MSAYMYVCERKCMPIDLITEKYLVKTLLNSAPQNLFFNLVHFMNTAFNDLSNDAI